MLKLMIKNEMQRAIQMKIIKSKTKGKRRRNSGNIESKLQIFSQNVVDNFLLTFLLRLGMGM